MDKIYGILPDEIFDKEKRQFKSCMYPITLFFVITFFQFLFGIFAGLPSFFYLSSFYFSLTVVALFHNHWVLNSFASPLWGVFLIIAAGGMLQPVPGYEGSWTGAPPVVALLWHGGSGIFSLIISFRGNTSLFLMLIATLLYSAWMYSASYLGLYACTDGLFCGVENQTICIAAGGIIVSLFVTVINHWKLNNGKVKGDCYGGVCPL